MNTMRKPTDEELKKGYINSRGGYQPPDELIDTVDIPALSPDAKTIHRGPFSEYLKRRREARRVATSLNDRPS
jgi:hypothetical protein